MHCKMRLLYIHIHINIYINFSHFGTDLPSSYLHTGQREFVILFHCAVVTYSGYFLNLGFSYYSESHSSR